jgi:NTP pyrophosphatase (non-canonical NTP hydrolase)
MRALQKQKQQLAMYRKSTGGTFTYDFCTGIIGFFRPSRNSVFQNALLDPTKAKAPDLGYNGRARAQNPTNQEAKSMNLYELHERMTGHLFPAYSNTDERFLALALCGEAGELADMMFKDTTFNIDEARDEVADCRVYLELIAKCFGIEGDKLVFKADTVTTARTSQLVLKLCAKSGLLANLIKKRWRDGVDLTDECRAMIVEIRSILEQIAWCLGIEGDKLDQRVVSKLEKVVEKHKARLITQVGAG